MSAMRANWLDHHNQNATATIPFAHRLLRRWPRILGISLFLTLIAFLYAWNSTPQYQGAARILIETSGPALARQVEGVEGFDHSQVQDDGVAGQEQLIGSSELLKQVAADLHLAVLPEFDPAHDLSWPKRLMILAGLGRNPFETSPDERVLNEMRDRLNIVRDGRTRFIDIEFTSSDRKLAAHVPNRIAETYVARQSEARGELVALASERVQPEKAVLPEGTSDSQSIEDRQTSAVQQQISLLAAELARVRANHSATEAHLATLRAGIKQGAAVETMPEVMASPIMQRLRERESELRMQIAEQSIRLLSNHPHLRELNAQMGALKEQIRAEMRNVLTVLEADLVALSQQQASLTADLNLLKSTSLQFDEAQTAPGSMVLDAKPRLALIDAAPVQAEVIKLPAQARVVSRAAVASDAFYPRLVAIAGGTFLISFILMLGLTIIQEMLKALAMRIADSAREPVLSVPMPDFVPATDPALMNSEGLDHEDAEGEALRQEVLGVDALADHLIEAGIIQAIFVSPEGDEGAAASVLVAREVADIGLRVILVDLTMAGATSGPMRDGRTEKGVTNLLVGEAQFTDCIHTDLYSECHILPVGNGDGIIAVENIDHLPTILRALSTAYDLVLVECGPVGAQDIERLINEATSVQISMINPQDERIIAAIEELNSAGFGEVMLIQPLGEHEDADGKPQLAAA